MIHRTAKLFVDLVELFGLTNLVTKYIFPIFLGFGFYRENNIVYVIGKDRKSLISGLEYLAEAIKEE